jgi:hypothetical protein
MLVKFEIPVRPFAELEKLAFGDGGQDADLYWSFVYTCRSGATCHNPVKGWTFPVIVGPVASGVAKDRGERKLVPDADQVSFHYPDGINFINDQPRGEECP